MVRTILRVVGVGFALLLVVALVRWIDRGSASETSAPDTFDVVAHRGVHTNWRKGTYDPIDGCEATHIYPPSRELVERGLIENTLESIGAAFDYGATIVEIDIRRTADDQLVIYHDSLLGCRTDGQGRVEEQLLAYLKTVDIGYGYTADEGRTYPFRGQGVGRMPTLSEVLRAYPDRSFLIDHKDGSLRTANLLAPILAALPAHQQEQIYYWGPADSLAAVREQAPHVRKFFTTRAEMKQWAIRYMLSLGFAGFPVESGDLVMGAPAAYARFAWGWPYRLLDRAHAAGARFFLMVDSEEDAQRYQDLPVDGIITDYIETVGPYFD